MKLKLFFFFFLISCTGVAKSSSNYSQIENDILVFDFNSYSPSYANSDFGEMKRNMKIAYYRDYVLYEIEVFNTTSKIDENGVINVRLDTNINNSSHMYFIVKKGAEKGLTFYNLEKSKVFVYEKFLNDMGLNFEDYTLFSFNLGKPDKIEIDSKKQLRLEKFSPEVKTNEDPDSIFRFYDKSLKGVDFSFSHAMDKKSNSKLWKIELIYNARKKPIENPAYKIYWKFERSNSFDKKLYLAYFQKFMAKHENNNPKN